MPNYFNAALHKFQHPTPLVSQYTPHLWNKPAYFSDTQYAEPEENLSPLPEKGITMVSKIVSTFLYYALEVNSTILVALVDLTSTQSKATEQSYNDVIWLLKYATSHPTAIVKYKQINMILQVHSNISYLSGTKARSRLGGVPLS